MLSVKGLSVRYGKSSETVLKDVTIDVGKDEIVSIVGANGAGKTTLINAISGMVKYQSGSISFQGNPLPTKANEVVRLGVVQVPEGRRVFAPLTIKENLLMGGYTVNNDLIAKTMNEMYDLFPILKERMNQPAGTLSGGEQQMLAIARAMISQPKLLLLDEPSLGIAPIIVKEIFRYLKQISTEKRIPMLIVEQNAKAVMQISDRVYVMESGKITLEGTAAEVASNPHVVETYFGGQGC